jgi:ATP-dependent phosphofructokinase / diphosphate-dependent phosphofructokinase
MTIGFDTALDIASDALDRLHSTAHSHHRIMIVEIMGQEAGWLTLGAGIASGADVILLPEIPYDSQVVAEAILKRNQSGKRFSIIAVSEGAISKEDVLFFEHARNVNEKIRKGDEKNRIGNQLDDMKIQFTGKTLHLAKQIEDFTGLETRVTILGYLQRGGVPSTYDRILATQLGTASVALAQEGHFGIMVAAKGLATEPIPLEEVVKKNKTVPMDHPWMVAARNLGTSLGDV